MFVNSAVKLAKEMDVSVCDCYSEWKVLSQTKDITKLLINRINHPTPEMLMFFSIGCLPCCLRCWK